MNLINFLYRFLDWLKPSGGILEQSVKSGMWSGMINIGDRAIQLGKIIILGNLLAPSDFGLMGLALLALAFFKRFTRLGLNTALIQREEKDVDQFLNTVWILKLSRGVALLLVTVIIAPFIASIFGEPRLTDVVRVVAFSTLLLGLQNPAIVYLRKNLKFDKQFVYRLSGTIVDTTTAVTFALVYHNVWALIVGLLAGNMIRVLVSYLLHEYRPQLQFDIEAAKELFGYGKWLTLSGIVVTLLRRGDDAFVGWFLGTASLGFYQYAWRLSNAPATEISQVITNVAFPAYSKLQDNDAKVREGFFMTLTLITAVSFPTAVGIAFISPYFVQIALGDQWLPVIIPMQVLAFYGAFRSTRGVTSSLYRALGRPDIDTKLTTAHFLIVAPLVYLNTTKFGLVGATFALVGGHFAITLADAYFATRLIDVSYLEFINRIKYPLLASLGMGGILFAVRYVMVTSTGVVPFVLLILLGVVTYVALSYLLNRWSSYRLGAVLLRIKTTVL